MTTAGAADTARATAATHLRRTVATWLMITLIVSLQVALAVSSMRDDSATDDEPAHIVSGYLKLTRGDISFYHYNPPLGSALVALPLLAVNPRVPVSWRHEPNPWNVGHAFLYASGNDADRILFISRSSTLVLYIALSLFTGAWVLRRTGSGLGAIATCVLTAFCPNLMAHGRLATIDLAVTLFILLALHSLLEWARQPTAGRALVAGLPVAAAVLTKVSALILFPWIACVVVAGALNRRSRARWQPLIRTGLLLVAWVMLLGETLYLLLMRQWWMEAAHPALSRSIPGKLLLPLLEYRRTLAEISSFMTAGFEKPQYLLGTFSTTGWWYYYPVAFGLKTTIPALLLLILAALVALWAIRNPLMAGRLPSDGIAVAFFVLIYAIVAMSGRLDLGMRYILPILPALYVLAGFVIGTVTSAVAAKDRTALSAFVLALLVWHTGECVMTWPNYIGYFNEFVRHRDDADAYLIDSNLDWGQDLKRLSKWVAANHVPRIRIDYFGGGSPAYYMGARAVEWRAPRPQPLPPGYFALSKHFYRASFYYRDFGLDYDQYLAGARKVATINGSIDVYEVR
jgi:4-amino-4-deoxy-L-arabinose transferase-like glycosyltransferase